MAEAVAPTQSRRRASTATQRCEAVARARPGVARRLPARGKPVTLPAMRDTELLRRRLWAQIGMPLAAWVALAGCDEGAPQQATALEQEVSPAAGDGGSGQVARPVYRPPSYEEIPAGEFDYFGPARDPFGSRDLDEDCPSGSWCGTAADARPFAVAGAPEQLGCPTKIAARPEVANATNQAAERWRGFSFHPMMQGRLSSTATAARRAAGEGEGEGKGKACCYEWFEYCSGRPLFAGDRQLLAELRPGASLCCPAAEVAAPSDWPDARLDEPVRAALARAWLEDARMEHAAISAFARAGLELRAMGAPTQLLAAVAAAAADEVEHARRCFGLAARFAGRSFEPIELPRLPARVHGPEPAAWVRLAVDSFVEGCVGESIAALIAWRGCQRCVDPASAATLEQIAGDEGRHAALAWRTVAWVLDVTELDTRAAVAAALHRQARVMTEAALATREPSPAERGLAAAQAKQLAAFGRLDARAQQQARRDAWRDLILPTLDACLVSAVGPRPSCEARA